MGPGIREHVVGFSLLREDHPHIAPKAQIGQFTSSQSAQANMQVAERGGSGGDGGGGASGGGGSYCCCSVRPHDAGHQRAA